MSVLLATEGPAVWRWCKTFEFKREGDGGALQPTLPLRAAVPRRTEHTDLRGQQTAGKKQTFKRAGTIPLRLNLSCFHMMTAKTIGLQTEGQNIASKSLLVC